MVDFVITLYPSNEKTFANQGLGELSDATTCKVAEEINGMYELELVYPVTGKHYKDIGLRSIILAEPNPYTEPQPFRVYQKSEPLDGLVTFNAQHISYDLDGYLVPPIEATSAAGLFSKLNQHKPSDCPFFFKTTVDSDLHFKSSIPLPMRRILGNDQGAVQDIYVGEFTFDRYNVSFDPRRGKNRGVSIAYGKNLIDYTQEQNLDNVFSAVHPYWYGGEQGKEELVELPEKELPAIGTFNYTRTYPLDVSSDFSEKPTVDELREYTRAFIEVYKIGVPKVSLHVSFLELSRANEFEKLALLERVYLGDTINVFFPDRGINATAECVRTEYDVISRQYISIDVGEAQANITGTIVDQGNGLANTPSYGDIDHAVENMQDNIEHVTDQITGNVGGYVVLKKNVNTGQPEEILIMDTDNITTASNVWRWNNEGLGFSSSGYPGPYRTAITSDGRIVADFITAGVMQADIIQGGVLRSKNGDFEFDLTNGTVKFAELKILTDFKEAVEEGGVSKLNTGIGLTIGDTSIDIFRQDSDSNLTNSLNETGMYVIKAKATPNEQIMLQATADGVIATDLSARNYLVVSDRVRYEKYGDSMLGCYWIGG